MLQTTRNNYPMALLVLVLAPDSCRLSHMLCIIRELQGFHNMLINMLGIIHISVPFLPWQAKGWPLTRGGLVNEKEGRVGNHFDSQIAPLALATAHTPHKCVLHGGQVFRAWHARSLGGGG